MDIAVAAVMVSRHRAYRLRRELIVSLLLAASSFARAVPAADLPDTISRVKPSVVAVGTFQSTRSPPDRFMGTGFVVANGHYVLTNEHVVSVKLDLKNRERLAIFVGPQGQVRYASVVARDMAHDLALLKMAGEGLPALKLGNSSTAREGQLCAFTGFPIGPVLGLHPVTHQGIISAITPVAIPLPDAANLNSTIISRLNHPFDVLQLDAVAYPGNSGSPLYDVATGAVLGIVNAVFVKESKESILQRPSGISYAIPINYARTLVNTLQE